jgi:hypothetical protein
MIVNDQRVADEEGKIVKIDAASHAHVSREISRADPQTYSCGSRGSWAIDELRAR